VLDLRFDGQRIAHFYKMNVRYRSFDISNRSSTGTLIHSHCICENHIAQLHAIRLHMLEGPALYGGGAGPGSDDCEYDGKRSTEPLAAEASFPQSSLARRVSCGGLSVLLDCSRPVPSSSAAGVIGARSNILSRRTFLSCSSCVMPVFFRYLGCMLKSWL
jgi:hypothetical protein